MDIGKAFGFVFDDDRWIVKILIAAAILAVGILFFWLIIPPFLAGFLLSGYGIEITRRVIRGTSPVLPEWENWGELFIDGLKAWLVELVYNLPLIAVGVSLSIPIAIAARDSEAAGQALNAVWSCLSFLWSIPMGLFLPAAIAHFVAKGDLGAAFRFEEVFALVRDNFATYMIILVMGWVASLIGGLGLLVCGVGILATGPYAGWFTSHLRGQAYRVATGEPALAVPEEIVA